MRMLRPALMLMLPLVLSACATFQSGPPSPKEVRSELQEGHSGRTNAVGAGSSPENAREAAMEGIAEQISTVVRSHHEQLYERADSASSQQVDQEQRIASTLDTLVHMELQGLSFSDPVQDDEGRYHVRASISQADLERAQAKAQRQAPVLARFSTIEGLPRGEHRERLRLAIEGLDKARERDVLDERVISERHGEQTFESYFQQVRQSTLDRIRVLPLVQPDGEQVRAAVIDAETYAPVRGITVLIGDAERETDSTGQTGQVEREKLADPQKIALRVGGETLEATAWRPESWRDTGDTQVFFHGRPRGQPVSVEEQSLSLPGRILLPSGESYSFTIHGGDDYRDVGGRLQLPPDAPYAYIHHDLEDKDFGELDLRIDGAGEIRIKGPTELEGDEIDSRTEVGSYEIEVAPPEGTDHPEDFQTLEDEILLSRDEKVQRVYEPPKDRRKHHEGGVFRWDLLGMSIYPDQYHPPVLEDGEVSLGEYPDSEAGRRNGIADIELGGAFLSGMFSYTRFEELLTRIPVSFGLQGGVRFSRMDVTDTDGNEHEGMLMTLQLAPTVGTFLPLSENNLLYASAGYGYRYQSASGDNDDVADPLGSRDTREVYESVFESGGAPYAFAEFGWQWHGLGLSAQVGLGDQQSIALNVSLGRNDVGPDYQLDASRQASEGDGFRTPSTP